MTEEIEIKLKIWANEYPESHHPNDHERFYDVVVQSYKDNYRIGGESIQEALINAGKLNSKEISIQASLYSELYHHLYSILEYVKVPSKLV